MIALFLILVAMVSFVLGYRYCALRYAEIVVKAEAFLRKTAERLQKDAEAKSNKE